MPIEQNERIARMKQDIENAHIVRLIDNIDIALEEYTQQINKKRGTIANNPSDEKISDSLRKIKSCLRLLKQNLISAAPHNKLNVWKIYSAEIKETSKAMDQLLIPSRLGKSYEAIKNLLRKLIVLFAPLEGTRLLNKTTETLTSCRSSLFSEIDRIQKHLNSKDQLEENNPDPLIEIYRSPIVPRIYS